MLTVQYANAFHRSAAHAHIKINTATPGYVATDLNNHTGNLTVEEGAEIVVELATLPDDGPSGSFFNDAGVVPW
jgi:NAD(P)-dependent dehydrogenase (short-subunit alcohol dehydrogenase family)